MSIVRECEQVGRGGCVECIEGRVKTGLIHRMIMMILEYKHPLLLDKVAFQFNCFSEIFNNKLDKYCI